jgi:hypothetical protein
MKSGRFDLSQFGIESIGLLGSSLGLGANPLGTKSEASRALKPCRAIGLRSRYGRRMLNGPGSACELNRYKRFLRPQLSPGHGPPRHRWRRSIFQDHGTQYGHSVTGSHQRHKQWEPRERIPTVCKEEVRKHGGQQHIQRMLSLMTLTSSGSLNAILWSGTVNTIL